LKIGRVQGPKVVSLGGPVGHLYGGGQTF